MEPSPTVVKSELVSPREPCFELFYFSFLFLYKKSCIKHSFISSYANDTGVKKEIATTSDFIEKKDVQEDLNSVIKW